MAVLRRQREAGFLAQWVEAGAAQLARDEHAVSVTPPQTKVTSLGLSTAETQVGRKGPSGPCPRPRLTRPCTSRSARGTASERTELRARGSLLLPGRRRLGTSACSLAGHVACLSSLSFSQLTDRL